MGIFKKVNMLSKGLRYKLMLAFSLMTIIPLLTCGYIISAYLFPKLDDLIDVSIVILSSVAVALLGLVLAKKLVDPVIDMAIETQIIASGEYNGKIAVSSDDEIGNLGQSINAMTQKIRSNIDELKSYGQKMKEVNVEIHKKMLALSSLLQIGDIISAGSVQLDSLLEFTAEEVSMVFDNGFSVLYMPKAEGGDFVAKTSHNIENETLRNLVIKPAGPGIFRKIFEENSIMVIDKGTKLSREAGEFMSSCGLKNILAIPMNSGRRNIALLLIGTMLDDYRFKPDDTDVIKVFARQITIAIESDILHRKAKELTIRDELTDLYNKGYILTRLEEEIKRAIFYQRPCSLIAFNIDGFKKFRDVRGELAAEEALMRVARIIKENTGPIGKAARIGGDEFAMLIPEKNKKGAAEVAEDVRKKIVSANLLKEGTANLTVSCGVSENPLDGATSDELFRKAMDALKQAKSSGRNKVVV